MLETLSNVKTYLGVTGSGDDIVLQMICEDVDAQIKSYVGYGIELATITREQHSTSGEADILTVDYPPIVSGDTVLVYDDDESNTPIDSDMYKVDEQSGTIVFIDTVPLRSVGEVSVTYTGGYAVVPQDIKMVFRQMARDSWNGRLRQSGVTSERLGDYSVSFGGNNSETKYGSDPLTPYKATLDKYRKYAF